MTRTKKKVLKVQQDPFTSFVMLITSVIHTIGVLGAVVAVVLYLILFKATLAQQQELVDRWILLKTDCQQQAFGVKLVLVLAAMFAVQQFYYTKKRRLDLQEIDRLKGKSRWSPKEGADETS